MQKPIEIVATAGCYVHLLRALLHLIGRLSDLLKVEASFKCMSSKGAVTLLNSHNHTEAGYRMSIYTGNPAFSNGNDPMDADEPSSADLYTFEELSE